LNGLLVLFVWFVLPVILLELAFNTMANRRTYPERHLHRFMALLLRAAQAVIEAAGQIGDLVADKLPKEHAHWREVVRIGVQVLPSVFIILGSLYLLGDGARYWGAPTPEHKTQS